MLLLTAIQPRGVPRHRTRGRRHDRGPTAGGLFVTELVKQSATLGRPNPIFSQPHLSKQKRKIAIVLPIREVRISPLRSFVVMFSALVSLAPE